MKLHVALVHHPVRNKLGETVTTAVTNLDVHDISRICRTYGARGVWLVNPLQSQHELFDPLLRFWREGGGAQHNAHRTEALELVRWSSSIADVMTSVEEQEAAQPFVVATTAIRRPGMCSVSSVQSIGKPVLLLLGTGHGLCEDVLEAADAVLEPIEGAGDGYNHLPVRAAAAILLDRLVGRVVSEK